MLNFSITPEEFSALSDAHKELYGPVEEGKHTLKVKGAVSSDRVAQLSQQLVAANSEAADHRRAAKAYKEIRTPEEIVAKIEKAAKGGKEEFEKILADTKAQHKGTVDGLKNTINTLRMDNAKNSLGAVLVKHDFLPESMDLALNHAKSRMKLDDDGAVTYLDKHGNIMTGDGSDGKATAENFAASLAEEVPFLIKSKKKGGADKIPGKGGDPNTTQTVPASQVDEMSAKERAAFFHNNPGVKVIPDQ